MPVLWDKKKRVIVNNESSDLLRIFNTAFNKLAKNPELDLYPEPLHGAIEEVGSAVLCLARSRCALQDSRALVLTFIFKASFYNVLHCLIELAAHLCATADVCQTLEPHAP